MKFDKKLIAIIIILAFGALFWNTSLNSNIVFGDEGYYAFISNHITNNHIYPSSEIFRDSDIYQMNLIKQPMFMLTESFFFLFGETAVKLMIPLFTVLTSLLIFVFMRKIGKEDIGIIAAALFMSVPAIVTYSVLNYVESLLLLFITCSFYFGYMAFETDSKYYVHMAGIFAGMAMLTKVTGPITLLLFLSYPVVTKQLKNKKIMKKAFTMILIGLVILAPFMIRNAILFKDVCYPPILQSKQCLETILQEAPVIAGLEFAGKNVGGGIEQGISTIGLMAYSQFAFGWLILLLLIFGLVATVPKKDKFDKTILYFFLSMIPLFFYLKDRRVEDLSRWTIPILIPISIIAANFLKDLYDYTKKKNKMRGIIVIVLILLFAFSLASTKSTNMVQVKSFGEGFYDGANWIDDNTPQDSLLLSIYAQQTAYATKRATSTALPDMKEILLTNDDRSYEHLILNGYDYVFVMLNIVSQTPYQESFPLGLLQYIDSSTKFEKVFDNSQVYGNSGVIIYKIL